MFYVLSLLFIFLFPRNVTTEIKLRNSYNLTEIYFKFQLNNKAYVGLEKQKQNKIYSNICV